MNHSPANIIAEYLFGEAILTDPDDSGLWHGYVGVLPDGIETDDDIAACIDTTPIKDGRVMDGAALFHFGVQILLRARTCNTGYAKAADLQDALAAVDDEQVIIGSNTYQIVNVSDATGIVNLGQEEGTKRRWMFSTNFIATIKEV